MTSKRSATWSLIDRNDRKKIKLEESIYDANEEPSQYHIIPSDISDNEVDSGDGGYDGDIDCEDGGESDDDGCGIDDDEAYDGDDEGYDDDDDDECDCSENGDDDVNNIQRNLRNAEKFLSIITWTEIIYMAIKNSTNEYVSCAEIQNFARRWFPIYRQKCYLSEISTFIIIYSNTMFIPNQIQIINSGEITPYPIRWTMNNMFTDHIDAILWKKFTNHELFIKSGMNNPDELFNILNGYGKNYLGLSISN